MPWLELQAVIYDMAMNDIASYDTSKKVYIGTFLKLLLPLVMIVYWWYQSIS